MCWGGGSTCKTEKRKWDKQPVGVRRQQGLLRTVKLLDGGEARLGAKRGVTSFKYRSLASSLSPPSL